MKITILSDSEVADLVLIEGSRIQYLDLVFDSFSVLGVTKISLVHGTEYYISATALAKALAAPKRQSWLCRLFGN